MTGTSPRDRELARELLDYEGRAAYGTPPISLGGAEALAAGNRVLEKMCDHLSRWFGAEGFDALLKRALDRTRTEYPFLTTVLRASCTDGRASGFISQAAPSEAATTLTEGMVAMIAQISRLLGEDMAAHLVDQIWPDMQRAECFPDWVLPPSRWTSRRRNRPRWKLSCAWAKAHPKRSPISLA